MILTHANHSFVNACRASPSKRFCVADCEAGQLHCKPLLEFDRDVLLEHYAAIAPEALDSLIPEERHRLYKLLLRITVIVQPDTTLEISGIFGEGLSVSSQGLVS